MASKFRYLLLLILFLGLTCGPAELSAQTGGGKVSGDELAEPVGDVSALTGKWTHGSIGRTTWTYTGSYADPNGTRFTYQFSPDGSVVYTSLSQATTANYSRMVVTSKKGRARLSGDTLTIQWGRGLIREDLIRERVSTSTKTFSAETETLKVAFKNSSTGKKQLCIVSKGGETCFSPAE
jgi:hypothetical protein